MDLADDWMAVIHEPRAVMQPDQKLIRRDALPTDIAARRGENLFQGRVESTKEPREGLSRTKKTLSFSARSS